MENKTYSKIACTLLGIALIGASALLYKGCNAEPRKDINKIGAKSINHATEIYEVEFDGQMYIVVQTYKGIGVCKK